MMHSDHMIAQCGWRSVFDQQTKAVELQNFISRWSNTILVDELDQYFTRICPATQTWRIETLQLDLGDIELEELPTELPKRLQASLQEAFGRLLMQQRLSISSAYRDNNDNFSNNSANNNSNLQILDHSISLLDFVSWFLLNGNLPWWYKGSASAVQILTHQIDQCPQATLDIIRNLGKTEAVRRRLVWQSGEPVVRKLVHLLEPWQGDFICTYADNLFKVQVQNQLPTDNATEFKQHTWFTILTYLLVDRGTLFNTIAFVRATLWQTAQRYQIDYQQLLAQLTGAVLALEKMGLVTQVFLTAITTISQQDQINKKEPIISEQVPIDYWAVMQQMLHYGRAWQTVRQDNFHQETVRIDELFTALANDDTERMAGLLRQEGKSENVRKKLLQHFSITELALVVRVVAPQDHLFILAHVEQTQPLVNQQAGDQKILWQVLLAYLFVDRGSYFNRRQFIYDTLMSVCNLQQLNYCIFLDLLINSVVHHPNGHRFELLAILQDLKTDVDRRQAITDERHPYWIAISHYLTTGEASTACDIALTVENYPVLFYRLINSTSQFSPATTATINSAAFAVLVRAPELASITNELLSQRLLQLIRPTDLRVLFMAIQADASEFCLALIRNLLRWHRQALLPSLAGMDLGLGLQALFIQALLTSSNIRVGLSKPFRVMDFWKSFSALLQHSAIDLRAFQQELSLAIKGVSIGQATHQRNGKRINTSTSVNLLQVLMACLPAELNTTQADTEVVPSTEINSTVTRIIKNHRVNLIQDFVQLRECLKAQPKGKQAEDALAVLWLRIISDSDAKPGYKSQYITLAGWLNRQTNKNQLIMVLISYRHIKPINTWLLAQLPNELNPPEEILTLWHELLLNSGLWQGTSAVLQTQLHNAFWSVIFSAPTNASTADQLSVKIFTLTCLRLNIGFGECIRRINRDMPSVKKSRWQQVNKLLIASSAITDTPQEINRKIVDNNAHKNIELHTAYRFSSHKPVSILYDSRKIVPKKIGSNFEQDYLAHYLNHPRFSEIVRSLLQQGRLPEGIVSAQAVEVDRLLFDIFTHCPQDLPAFIGDLLQHQGVIFRLINLVSFTWLIDALRKIAPHNESTILLIERFYRSIQQMDLPHLSQQQRLGIYFQLVLKHGLNKNWAALAPDKLVGSYCWQLMQQQGLSKTDLQRAFSAHKERMAELLQLALSNVLEQSSAPIVELGAPAILRNLPSQKKLPSITRQAHRPPPMLVPMKINNAGLVILQSFITPLFSRLGLVSEGKFVTHSARRRAVHYLQYLVTGCCATAEQNLMLNKLLCGLALYEPVEYEIEISPAEQEICHSLLKSVIAYWSAIGSSSYEGFRGNWLVRDGSLTEAKDRWDLIIDKRAYDLLLARSPFSYSIIKMPWMDKPIYVTWPT